MPLEAAVPGRPQARRKAGEVCARAESVLDLIKRRKRMKIGFVVNDIATEEPGYTTIRLAMAAINRGHEAWLMGAGDFAYDADEKIRARARSVPEEEVQVVRELSCRPAGEEGDLGANHRRRSRRADAAQRPVHRHGLPRWAQAARDHLRPGGHAARRDRAQRSQRPRQGDEQDVLPALPRRGAPRHADHAGSGRDQGLRQGARADTSC